MEYVTEWRDSLETIENNLSYFSRKCNQHERVYSTIEEEALSIVLALDHFEVYVGSASITIYTATIYCYHLHRS